MTWHTEFGVTKICFDVSMTVIAGVLSFVFAGKLDGVREGTVIVRFYLLDLLHVYLDVSYLLWSQCCSQIQILTQI